MLGRPRGTRRSANDLPKISTALVLAAWLPSIRRESAATSILFGVAFVIVVEKPKSRPGVSGPAEPDHVGACGANSPTVMEA